MTPDRAPRILIVGAGAVGQVYGLHMHRAGAQVSYYVRERHVETCKQGFDLFEIGLFRPTSRARHHQFYAHDLLTSPEEVASRTWDQVWLTIPSNALQGPWLAPFIEATGEHATIVCLQPGPTDRDLLARLVAPARIVQGMIAFIAYQGPLPGEHLPKPHERGLIFWHPPSSASPFGGERVDATRVDAILEVLRKGRCPVKAQQDIGVQSAFPTTLLMPFLMALEMESWKLDDLRHSPWLVVANRATEEAKAIMAKRNGVHAPGSLELYRPWSARLALRVAPPLSPLPLQAYLRYHFTKVGEQTRQTMRTYIELGEDVGLPTTSLRHLHDGYHAACASTEDP